MKNDDELDQFITEMSKLKGVSDVNVISSKNDLEY
jgi:hypothetical protein